MISGVRAIDGTHGDRCGAQGMDIKARGMVQVHMQ